MIVGTYYSKMSTKGQQLRNNSCENQCFYLIRTFKSFFSLRMFLAFKKRYLMNDLEISMLKTISSLSI